MILFPSIVILVLIFIFYSSALFKSNKKILSEDNPKNDSLPISIVVALKNEARNVPFLINSLKNLNYPTEKMEVIFIDDNSSDSTFNKVLEEIKSLPNFSVFKVGSKKIPGKKGALQFGITKASNPYILITDADCKPEPEWIKYASGKFSQGYNLIFGIAPFENENFLINKISCFENLRSSILSFGLSGLNIFYSAAARNFGFKKESFKEIKGYSNTSETLSGDDDLFIREAVKNNFKIGMFTNKKGFVFSSTKKNFSEYLKQKSRHTKTSLYYSSKIKIIIGSWHLINLLLLSSIAASFLNWIFILPFLVKLIVDEYMIKKLQNFYSYDFGIKEIFFLQITYEILLVINFFNAVFRKDKWN